MDTSDCASIGADSDDDDDAASDRGDSDNQHSQSDDERSDNNASLSTTDDDDDGRSHRRSRSARFSRHRQWEQLSRQASSNQDDVDEQGSAQSPPAEETKKPPKLLSIPGFSNSEALKTRLPVRRTAHTALVSTPYAPAAVERSTSVKGLPHKLALKQQQQQQQQQIRSKSQLDPLALRTDRLALKKRQQQQQLGLVPERVMDGDDFAARGKSLEHKIAMHEELARLDVKKKRGDHASSLFPQLEAPAQDPPRRATVAYRMTAPMVYAIACTSAATLHCALFNFSLELRRLWRVDALPFGVFLLACWAIAGFLSFAGGWLGDLVRDRVTLMRRSALLWAFATLLLHVAAFRAGSVLSAIALALALPAACVAHGVLAPNCVVLGAYTFSPANDRRCRQRRRPSEAGRDDPDGVCASTPREDSSESESERDDAAVARKKLAHEHVDIAVGDDYMRRSSDVDERAQQLLAARKMAIHRYFSRCLGATLAGSSSVQLFFFLLVDVDSLPLSLPTSSSSSSSSPSSTVLAAARDAPSPQSLVGRKGYLCMLLASALLLAALICFLFHSHSHFQPLPPRRAATALERKLALHEQAHDAFSWRAIVRVFSRTVAGYALVLALVVALVGVGMAVVSMLVVSGTSFNVRLASFLMICAGWYAAMSIGRYQLRSTSALSTTCERLGIPILQLQSALLLVFFVCMSALSAFLRAQLYTTLVVQACQTRLDLPGVGALLNPNALGALASVVSIVLIPISNATVRRPRKARATPSPPRRLCVTAISPSRRLSIGICLYLVGIFLSSIIELYRRKRVSIAEPQPKCTKAHSDFDVLWTAPHVVLLGLSDTVFRVSLYEQLHSIRLLTSRWPGFLQGVVEFSEMVGYVGALALTSTLSSWLFRPHTSDLAVVLLLMTTLLAFAYASLKRVAEKIAAGHIGACG